jgi:protein TonB
LALNCLGAPSFASPTFSIGTQESSNYAEAEVLSAPHPEIPSSLHENCFKSCCIARFLIGTNGKASVKLISSSGNEEVDDIALKTLQQWKFKPATIDGKPIESARKIRVEFEVN